MQETLDGAWMNIGVDVARQMTPPRYQPGIGLRPGERDHPAAPLVPTLYAALYDSIGAHSRLGLNVVVDVAHHDADVLRDCARRLRGSSVLFVGVRCPIEVIMERRRESAPGSYAVGSADDPVPEPVRAWQRDVHVAAYDLELDTSQLTPGQCAEAVRRRLVDGPPPNAFARLGI